MDTEIGRREEQSLTMLVFQDLRVSRGFRKSKRLPERVPLVLELWFYDFATDVKIDVYEEHRWLAIHRSDSMLYQKTDLCSVSQNRK